MQAAAQYAQHAVRAQEPFWPVLQADDPDHRHRECAVVDRGRVQPGQVRMSRNALEAARHEFHWEKESQQLIGLYRDILRIEHADPELLTPYA